MSAADTLSGLSAFPGRGAGTDAERRAALWLAERAASPGRTARVQTFWCRPNRALAHAWHVALALAGSVVMVSDPTIGGALALAALACVALDAVTGVSPGRRLTPEHASQNVVSEPVASDAASAAPAALALIVTAPYDAGRRGLVDAAPLRRLTARARRLAAGGRLTPGWLGWLALAMAWLVVVALVRRAGTGDAAIAVLQTIPSAGLIVALAALLGVGGAAYRPGAGDDGSGTAVALALVDALDTAALDGVRVTLVLQGAGDADGIGLRRHLRDRRRPLRDRPTAVLGIAACSAGAPRWWHSDGPLWPLRYHPRLRAIAADVAAAGSTTAPGGGHRGRGSGPALCARLVGLPALTLGCLDRDGLLAGSRRNGDLAEAVDPAAMDALLAFALAFVAALGANRRGPAA
jgi:hypothetical protein